MSGVLATETQYIMETWKPIYILKGECMKRRIVDFLGGLMAGCIASAVVSSIVTKRTENSMTKTIHDVNTALGDDWR